MYVLAGRKFIYHLQVATMSSGFDGVSIEVYK